MEDSQDQRERGHCLFAAGEQQNILEALARRLRHQVDARFQFVVGFDQAHLAAAAAEQFLEQLAEVLIDFLERVAEALARAALNLTQTPLRLRQCLW